MNQSPVKLVGVVAACLAISQTAARAESLEEAWVTALGADLALEVAESHVAAATQDLSAARAGRMPVLSVSAGYSRFDEPPVFDFSGAGVPATLPLFEGDSVETADARITMPLFTGGSLKNGIDAAESAVSAQAARSSATVQYVKLSVARHYIDVLRAQSAIAVADSNVASLKAHVRDVKDMYESGAVARNDFLSAAVSLADAEQRRLQASNALDLAHAAYNRALGRQLGASVDLDETLPGIDSQLDLNSLESLTETAIADRSELDSLEAAADVYDYQARATRGEALPQLAVTAGYMSMPNQFLNRDDYWMVGIGVQWDLFDGGQSRRKADAMSFRARALQQEQANLESMIRLEVRQAWLRLKETQERVRLTEQAVEQAEENLRVVRDRYRNGEGTNTEVLDAEVLRLLSRSNYDNADFDAKLALYELARGVGRL